jgi:Zn-dependent peptidase ImmA (M78 family)
MEKQDIRLFDLWHETVHLCTHEGIRSCRRPT